jgi:hypothetical protein
MITAGLAALFWRIRSKAAETRRGAIFFALHDVGKVAGEQPDERARELSITVFGDERMMVDRLVQCPQVPLELGRAGADPEGERESRWRVAGARHGRPARPR